MKLLKSKKLWIIIAVIAVLIGASNVFNRVLPYLRTHEVKNCSWAMGCGPAGVGVVADTRPNGNDYPAYLAGAPTDSFADPWGMGNRGCESYAAWKVYETDNYMIKFKDTLGYGADAKEWPKLAKLSGFKVSSIPAVGTVAIFQPGWTGELVVGNNATKFTENNSGGHAAWVERVNTDGSIYVSEYDGTDGQFDYATYPGAGLQYIYFNQKH